VVVFGGKGEQALPAPDEMNQLLRHPQTSLVLDLSAMSLSEKAAYATTVLAVITAVRSTTGLPHWLIIDEAHHVLPAEGSPAAELLRPGAESLAMITLAARDLAPAVRRLPTVVVSTEIAAFQEGVQSVLGARGEPSLAPSADGRPLERGEAAIAWLDAAPHVTTFRVGKRRVLHRRHVRKYTEGELPPDRSFFFRGPTGSLNLRAANLTRFVELAEGVDEATWLHHLQQRDYSTWLRDMIKDPELAGEIASFERSGLTAADSRRQVLERVRQKYAV
jgi:hypothetical protein